MIHQELGYAYVKTGDGPGEPVEMGNPRDALLAAEEGFSGDAMLCMIEAARDWLWWIYEAGPEPVPVMRRLVACTAANAPWLLERLSRREARALSPLAEEKYSLKVVCRASPEDVHEALAQAYRREGRTWARPEHITTIEMRLLVEAAITGDDALLRGKAMSTWLARVWDYEETEGGKAESGELRAESQKSRRQWTPSLRTALKNLYVEARTLAPEMILNMTGEEISALFDQVRAAESARVKQRVNLRLLRSGYRHATLRFQKSVSACRTYSEKAKGNKNRAGAKASAA